MKWLSLHAGLDLKESLHVRDSHILGTSRNWDKGSKFFDVKYSMLLLWTKSLKIVYFCFSSPVNKNKDKESTEIREQPCTIIKTEEKLHWNGKYLQPSNWTWICPNFKSAYAVCLHVYFGLVWLYNIIRQTYFSSLWLYRVNQPVCFHGTPRIETW